MLSRFLCPWTGAFVFIGSLLGSCVLGDQPIELRVGENFVDPVGFHDPAPVFSWKLPSDGSVEAQAAYQIIVKDRSSNDPSEGTLWDSGKVESDQSVWVPYGGPPLRSRQKVSWKVRFWDDQGKESDWSQVASIEMGLLAQADWEGSWIEMDRLPSGPDTINVVKAEFGDRTSSPAKVADVTERIRGAIKRGSTPIRVVVGRMGVDPAPGKARTLWVDYEVNGKRKQVEVAENKPFDPYPPITAHPGYYLRREFQANDKIVGARLYVSALGIDDLKINGQPVGADQLAPGYTMYSKRVESLTYDVTDLIHEGRNAIGALLGEGWYAGNLLLRKRADLSKLTPKLLVQLELKYADGRIEKIVSDTNWRATDEGPIIAGGYYHGEDYDASKELGDWSLPGFDDSKWRKTRATEIGESPSIVPKRMPSVQVMQSVRAVKMTEPEPGRYVFDFGQNLVGVPQITMPVADGEAVLIRFAEMLEQDGTLYTTNYRSARSQATYLANKNGMVQYRPTLSFFGFRYVELSGLAAGHRLTKESVVAQVLHTRFPSSGRFTSSHEKLNQLQSNIRWGQISNFVDIPTDCPQRDERLGWTGDAQVFLPTSFFNYDVYSFWARWLQSVRDEQTDEGGIPHTVPSTPFGESSPGWADVIVTAPWQIYVRTGDIRILQDNYEAMKQWLAVYERRSENYIPDLTGWGDWLQPYTKADRKGDTAQDLIATAYFGRGARIMQQTAEALGNQRDAERYEKLHADIRRAFSAHYFPSGKTHPGAETQTACLMGLGYDLIERDQRKRVEKLLLKQFDEADRHLRTGFLGTPLLAPVFDDLGHGDICYELLFKETYPSWFYSINQGATTMWERWNSYSHADGFGDASMNSFNHYAYGAIGQFMYERVAGLSPDPQNPGYKHFFLRPLIAKPLKSASAELDTPYGIARSSWKTTANGVIVEAIVPANTTATAILPTAQARNVQLNEEPLDQNATKLVDGSIVVRLRPGKHQFTITDIDLAGLPDIITPPEGGQEIVAFGIDHPIDFEFQDVQAEAEWTNVSGLPFEQCYGIKSDKRFSARANMRLELPIRQTIRQGDVILVSYWIRRPKAGGQPNNVYLSIGDPDQQAVYENRLSAYREWKQHVRSFTASQDVNADRGRVRFDLGEAGTDVQVADVRLINYGPEWRIESLPKSTVMYAGRDANAPWRKAALERIETIRKGDLEIEVVDAHGQAVPDARVFVEMQKHAFGFGSAVNAEMLGAHESDFPITLKKQIEVSWRDAQQYREIIQKYFDRVTFESALRPHSWQRLNREDPTSQRKKAVLFENTFPWLLDHKIAARGHYIGWAPMDFNAFEKQFVGDPDKHREWLWSHMASVLPATSRYVNEWDTINHIIGWGKHTYEKEYGGPEIYAEIMAEARRLAPDAIHAINEGKVLPDGYKREPYKAVIQFLNEQGQAPDVVGFMGHFGLTSLTPPEELLQVYDEFAEVAPRLQLSEFDVDAGDDEQLQADYFRDVMIASFSHPKFEAICQWGFWEKLHWKPSAALWRDDWTLKPVGEVFVDLVGNQWWTNQQHRTDSVGNCQTRGFLGQYKITVENDGVSASVVVAIERKRNQIRIQLP